MVLLDFVILYTFFLSVGSPCQCGGTQQVRLTSFAFPGLTSSAGYGARLVRTFDCCVVDSATLTCELDELKFLCELRRTRFSDQTVGPLRKAQTLPPCEEHEDPRFVFTRLRKYLSNFSRPPAARRTAAHQSLTWSCPKVREWCHISDSVQHPFAAACRRPAATAE